MSIKVIEENQERRLWNIVGDGGGDELKIGKTGKA